MKWRRLAIEERREKAAQSQSRTHIRVFPAREPQPIRACRKIVGPSNCLAQLAHPNLLHPLALERLRMLIKKYCCCLLIKCSVLRLEGQCFRGFVGSAGARLVLPTNQFHHLAER